MPPSPYVGRTPMSEVPSVGTSARGPSTRPTVGQDVEAAGRPGLAQWVRSALSNDERIIASVAAAPDGTAAALDDDGRRSRGTSVDLDPTDDPSLITAWPSAAAPPAASTALPALIRLVPVTTSAVAGVGPGQSARPRDDHPGRSTSLTTDPTDVAPPPRRGHGARSRNGLAATPATALPAPTTPHPSIVPSSVGCQIVPSSEPRVVQAPQSSNSARTAGKAIRYPDVHQVPAGVGRTDIVSGAPTATRALPGVLGQHLSPRPVGSVVAPPALVALTARPSSAAVPGDPVDVAKPHVVRALSSASLPAATEPVAAPVSTLAIDSWSPPLRLSSAVSVVAPPRAADGGPVPLREAQRVAVVTASVSGLSQPVARPSTRPAVVATSSGLTAAPPARQTPSTSSAASDAPLPAAPATRGELARALQPSTTFGLPREQPDPDRPLTATPADVEVRPSSENGLDLEHVGHHALGLERVDGRSPRVDGARTELQSLRSAGLAPAVRPLPSASSVAAPQRLLSSPELEMVETAQVQESSTTWDPPPLVAGEGALLAVTRTVPESEEGTTAAPVVTPSGSRPAAGSVTPPTVPEQVTTRSRGVGTTLLDDAPAAPAANPGRGRAALEQVTSGAGGTSSSAVRWQVDVDASVDHAGAAVSLLPSATVLAVGTSAPTSTASVTHDVRGQLVEPVTRAARRAWAAGSAGADIAVVLRPEGLGRVHVGARVVDGRVHVEISCDSDEGTAAVRSTVEGLRQHLDASAAAETRVVVQRMPEPDTASPTASGGAATWSAPGRGGNGSTASHPHGDSRDARPPPDRDVPLAVGASAAPRRFRQGPDLDLLI